jgi:hypothetical protein
MSSRISVIEFRENLAIDEPQFDTLAEQVLTTS